MVLLLHLIELIPKEKILLPPITQNTNLENINNYNYDYNFNNKDDINNDNSGFKEISFNDYNPKKEESNNFSNISSINENN